MIQIPGPAEIFIHVIAACLMTLILGPLAWLVFSALVNKLLLVSLAIRQAIHGRQ
jgi:hypothetical protein